MKGHEGKEVTIDGETWVVWTPSVTRGRWWLARVVDGKTHWAEGRYSSQTGQWSLV